MNEALRGIQKNRDYHARQLEENNAQIQRHKDSIRILTECNEKEERLVREYDEILAKLKD